MPAYLIARVQVTDPARYKRYVEAVQGVIQEFGGKYLARGGESVMLEGPPEPRRIIVVEFPSIERIKAFYDSPEYVEVRKLRAGAATGTLEAVEAVSSEADSAPAR